MCTGFEIGALAIGLAGAATGAKGAYDQKKAADRQARLIKKQQEAEKEQALEERRKKIDALRESGVGLTTGRRTLLAGSELGMTSQSNMDGINNQLG